MNNKKIAPTLLLLIVGFGLGIFSCGLDIYADVSDSQALRRLVIMENGRRKPLDTFAENTLKQFSGQSRFEKQPAISWLARVLFTPQVADNDKIFLVTNPEVLDSMSVERLGKARDRYSFAQLQPGIERLRQLAVNVSRLDEKNRSFIENEIISLYNKLYIYRQLQLSFDFLFPHSDFTVKLDETRRLLGLPAKQAQYCFLDILRKKIQIRQATTTIQAKTPDQYSDSDKEIIRLGEQLSSWAKFHTELPLTIIPLIHQEAKTEDAKETWGSPWDILSPIVFSPGLISDETNRIHEFVQAYTANDAARFEQAVTAFNALVSAKAHNGIREKAISLEVFYNRLDPFYKCKFFYGFSVLFLLLSFIALQKWFYRLSFLLLGIGFLLHLFGVIARGYIMQRPPVTNLYETFIFTGLMTALLGMILEFFKKKNIGISTGSLAGFVMLMIAGKYAMEGDTMGMLVAVLDSNFWLASHVITIILGYSGIVLSGFIGHVYIIQRIFQPAKKDLLNSTFQAVYAIQAFGIIFTCLGTVLGGIWADQSWGRFWGWDPKENGALFILLWSAILFHARLAGWIKELGMAFGSVFGVIAVSLAWFGVNLLGVGLHTYGFTSGVARALFIFIAFEFLFMLGGAVLLQLKKPAHP